MILMAKYIPSQKEYIAKIIFITVNKWRFYEFSNFIQQRTTAWDLSETAYVLYRQSKMIESKIVSQKRKKSSQFDFYFSQTPLK